MSLQATNLILQVSQIPATFAGTPNDLVTEIVRRARIVSPSGTNFIFIGDTEPTSNVGPWLKNGTQWWVFSNDIKRYVPLDISPSEKLWYWVGDLTPPTSNPALWLKTATTNTISADPSVVGAPIGWYHFDGANWVPSNSIVRSGSTASRPGAPVNYQQYYDTDISCLIWWERNLWRTVSGVPGDIKYVAFESLAAALQFNPGWDLFGAANQSIRGRYISQATKDNEGTNVTVNAGVPVRNSFEIYGEDTGVKVDNTSTVKYPPTVALWALVKL